MPAHPHATAPDGARHLLTALACWAVALPMLIAYNVPPSATFLNQAASLIGWGAFIAWLGWQAPGALRWPTVRWPGGLASLFAAFGVLVLTALVSWGWRGLPAGLALSPIGGLLAAVLVTAAGASLGQHGRLVPVFAAVCWALVVACALSAIVGLLQVFAPQWTDGTWIAGAAFEGRASGNLRQPNHLSSLLLWGLIAVAWLLEAGQLTTRRAAAVAAVFMWVLVLSASRTGALGVLLLCGWGALDRRRPRAVRLGLLAAPVAYALFWLAMALWAKESHQVFGSEVRLTQDGDISSSRFRIWSDTLSLIAHHPWAGVGFGNFNFAWSLTPFPHRPFAFFDHTHNLPLQFAVELGIPVALVLLGLFGHALWGAWRAGRPANLAGTPAASVRRAAFMVVLMMALHSQLEYPLWYAYFLLPTAFAFGLCLGLPTATSATTTTAAKRPAGRAADWLDRRLPMRLAGAALFILGALAVVDYERVVVIFSGNDDRSLATRIASGEHSVFFDHHAHYAAVTTAEHPSDEMASFRIVTHYLLDTRLMMAWARAYHEQGDDQRARHIAQRLREFKNADAKPFFEPCDDPPSPTAALPFQCTPPSVELDYRDFE